MEKYLILAQAIRSGQVPHEDLPEIFKDEVFAKWYQTQEENANPVL